MKIISDFSANIKGFKIDVSYIKDSERYDVYSANDWIGSIYLAEFDKVYIAQTEYGAEVHRSASLEAALRVLTNRHERLLQCGDKK